MLQGLPDFSMTSIVKTTHPQDCKLEKTNYNVWSVFCLSNGIVKLYLAPQLGGRAIQIKLGDHPYLFVNKDLSGRVLPEEENNRKAGWANYGGDKVWPGPEGWTSDQEWPSIPYYILDGAPHKGEVMSDRPEKVAFRMTSPRDPRTGIQFERTFILERGSTRIKVNEVMRNVSRRKVRWGIWHATQHEAADYNDSTKPNPELFAYAPLNPKSMHERGYYVIFGGPDHPSFKTQKERRILQVHYLYRVAKVGVDASLGWLAVVNGQLKYAFVETFPYYPKRSYPDDAPVEFWNNGPGTISRGPFDQVFPNDRSQTPYFFESEVLSPYAELEPSEEYEFCVSWWLARSKNPIHDVVWAGVVSSPLSVSIDGKHVTLRGSFGVFHLGIVEVTFYSREGELLSRSNLMAANPEKLVDLRKTVALPEGAYRVTIGVRDADDESRGVLGDVIL